MQLKISDLLDDLAAPDIALKETQAVSADRIKEIAMNKIRTETKQHRSKLKRPAAAIMAAALALALGITAFAVAYHGDFFNNVFGKGIDGQETHTVVLNDGSDGELPLSEHFPTVERVEVDADKAEELVGSYVTSVAQSITLGNYTFTVEDVLLDENGIGALTVRVENPDGHGLKQSGSPDGSPPFGSAIRLESEDYGLLDSQNYLVTDSLTETEATYVYYVTPTEPLPKDEALALVLTFILYDNTEPDAVFPEASITIPSTDKVATRSFTAEDAHADLSPVGMTLYYDIGTTQVTETIESSIVIRYSDDSEYIVLGEDLINESLSCKNLDENIQWIAFNRLADVDNITEIQIAGHWYEDDGSSHSFDLILSNAD